MTLSSSLVLNRFRPHGAVGMAHLSRDLRREVRLAGGGHGVRGAGRHEGALDLPEAHIA